MMKKICVLDIKLKLLSGMHIGGYDSTFDIGGADSDVIKNPLNRQPYIPGSSFKGKLKSLLTYKNGKVSGDKIEISDPVIRNIFESVILDESRPSITRALFRDLILTDGSKQYLESILGYETYTEIKAENSIDQLKGTAKSPRFIERVPTGAEFNGQIVLTVFEGDDEAKMKAAIEESLSLLELNYIGGSGSRGYGRVKIEKEAWKDETI